MKRILKLTSLLAIIFFIALIGSVYAADIDCNVEITTAKNDFAKNEEFVANVEVKNINANPGIIAVSAVLEYDRNSLTLVSMSGKNSWDTPSYNDSNGKMVLTRANPSTANEGMFEVKFKVNEGSVANPVITVKDIDLSNGDGKKTITSVSKTINVTGGTANNNNSNNNNNQGTTTDNNNNNQSTTTTQEQNKPVYNDGNTKPDNKYDRTNITGNGKKQESTDKTTTSSEGSTTTGESSTELTGTTTPVTTTPSTNTDTSSSSTSTSTVTTVKADGEIPKAGLSSFSMWLIIFTIVVVVVALVGYGILMATDKRNND